MTQNRGFTLGFVAIERFLILMIHSKKIRTKRLCHNSEVVAIQRCRNWEVPLYVKEFYPYSLIVLIIADFFFNQI